MYYCCFSIPANLCESMKKRRETPIVQGIGDIMLARVSVSFLNTPPFVYEAYETCYVCVCSLVRGRGWRSVWGAGVSSVQSAESSAGAHQEQTAQRPSIRPPHTGNACIASLPRFSKSLMDNDQAVQMFWLYHVLCWDLTLWCLAGMWGQSSLPQVTAERSAGVWDAALD